MAHDSVWPGRPYPLGATPDENGVNFAVYAGNATGVEVCLFDPDHPNKQIRRIHLTSQTDRVWHGYLPGLRAGALYGLRVKGSYDPLRGLRFNPSKLLVDPYARAIHGAVDFKGHVLGYRKNHKEQDLVIDEQDDADYVPRSVVVASDFDWKGIGRPQIPWHRSLIYEAHVRGFTMRHPGVPPEMRGTYAGFAQPAVIEHLQRLGVTAVELLPVQEHVDEGFLREKGLSNYWGYNTLGFFAPDQRHAHLGTRGEQVNEFKWMVKTLHEAGIEVILDVVYNHTGEGNHLGPTLSLRGIDNIAYYSLRADDPRYYVDHSGCGNSLNSGSSQALRLILDSLRYWAEEMQVDGFRFDLAPALARPRGSFERGAPFFQIVYQDPVLSKLKLIAEPWDIGDGGYQVGNFPLGWSEWNGKYRDAIRKYWKGEDSQAAELGSRLSGSSDLYQPNGKRPWASVNFVTCHDGFTLEDLVSYNVKHNEANKEDNRDGNADNHSWNCGVEGETSDEKILAQRERDKRNLMATLLLSQGVPMLWAGDEMGRTQRGNNNAYCQDNEISWVNWDLSARQQAFLEFTCRLAKLRRDQPVLQRRRFFRGTHIWDSALKDLAWFRPDGVEMTREDWQKPFVRSLSFLLGGDALASPDERGNRIVGDTLLVLMNAHNGPLVFTLPANEWGTDWRLEVNTADGTTAAQEVTAAGGKIEVPGRSLMVLRHPPIN